MILKLYDQMKDAIESGEEDQTWIDAPPSDGKATHHSVMYVNSSRDQVRL